MSLHFFAVRFIMLERDYKWIIVALSVWVMANLATDADGLLFSQAKGAKNIIKIALGAYTIAAATSLYFMLCKASQWYKRVSERREQKKLLREYGRANYDDSDDYDGSDKDSTEEGEEDNAGE
jgi:hypothetical protein